MAHAGKTFHTTTTRIAPHDLAPRSRITREQFAPEHQSSVTAAPAGQRVAITVVGDTKAVGHTTIDTTGGRELAATIVALCDEADASAKASAPAAE
jgi:hypothetical protein